MCCLLRMGLHRWASLARVVFFILPLAAPSSRDVNLHRVVSHDNTAQSALDALKSRRPLAMATPGGLAQASVGMAPGTAMATVSHASVNSTDFASEHSVAAALMRLKAAISKHEDSGSFGGSQAPQLDSLAAASLPASGAAAAAGEVRWDAFVLSLKRRPERLNGFIQALKEQEPWILSRLNYVWAVDGKELSLDMTARDALVNNGFVANSDLKQSLKEPLALVWWDLSPGAIGCYLSHAMAWEQIVERNLDYGLVFEDDMRHFSKAFEGSVRSSLIETKTSPGDIVYLQHCDSSSEWPRGSPTPPEGSSFVRHLDSDLIVPCTAGYMVSQRAARQLLHRAFPIKTQLDRAMAGDTVKGLSRLRFEPALAQVGNISMESDVQDTSTGLTWLMNYMGIRLSDIFSGAAEAPVSAEPLAAPVVVSAAALGGAKATNSNLQQLGENVTAGSLLQGHD